MSYPIHSNLVQGFAAYSGTNAPDGSRLYHHIAVYPDGRTYITAEHFPMSETHFDKPSRKWNVFNSTADEIRNQELSADFHWLGNYPFLFNVK